MAYLLPCECGQKLSVGPAQAGETVTCGCGKTLEVPTLRGLRQLETDQAAPSAPAGTGWSLRQGALTAGLLLAAVLAGNAVWMQASDPSPPQGFSASRSTAVLEAGLNRLTPLQGYQRWVELYRPMRRFDQQEDPREEALRMYLTKRTVLRYALWAGAAFALVAGVGVSLSTSDNPQAIASDPSQY